MDLQEEEEKPQKITSYFNDENNNFQNCKNENNVQNTSSDDEYRCSSCSSINDDSELISLDTRKIWHDIAHLIKCIYRETNREFTENHTTKDICKAKEYVQILTQLDAESLFNNIESIVLEYVNEIRNQVLKRFQICLKTSNDVQLFISYLLDEYNTFIQAAKNVSIIISYLEEYYMKSFHLTWLLYNKHLYEKLVYMDKKIQHSMSTMIDLLQPSNDIDNNYSPAEYTQLLNRFLTFDEEMSEIDCLYKDCQTKMNTITKNTRNQTGIIIKTKTKKICKKTKKNRNILGLNKDHLNSSTTNAVNIPLSNNSSIIPITSQQGSNGSSIGSDIGGKECSSISSYDEYLLNNNTSSSSYTKEESDNLINNNDDKSKPITNEITMNNNEQLSSINSIKKSKSNRRKENLTTSNISLPKISLTSDIIFPPKPPSSKGAKLQADFRPLTIPLLTKTEIPTCVSHLSAKIQSVSFTAGTFGSITTNENSHILSNNQKRLNINLSRKQGSSIKTDPTMTLNNLDQFLRHTSSNNDLSTLLSSFDSSKSIDELQKSYLNDKNYDLCSCDSTSESNSSITNPCLNCMSLPSNSPTITYTFNPRDIETKERLKLKLTKRTIQNTSEQQGNKSKIKPYENNIDDLVRYIDGNETISNENLSKKSKKKKDKQQINDNIKQNQLQSNNSQTSSKRKRKTKVKLEQENEKSSTSPITIPSSPPPLQPSPPPPPPIEKIPSIKSLNIIPPSEIPISPEEEVNWITISRKQSKHKSTPTPSSPNNTKQKRQQTIPKSKTTHTSNIAQQKPIAENNKQQNINIITPSTNHNSVKTIQQQKTESTSAWSTPEQSQILSSSTLHPTAPPFIPSSSIIIPNKTNDILPLDQSSSSLYWNPNGYLIPPGPVQRPNSSISRCIQRPTSEQRNTPFPINSSVDNTTWNNISKINSNESQWKYSSDEQLIPNDFPLYDPFKSGTGLTIPSSIHYNLNENFNNLNILQDNNIDEMDALDKEIEDFKKSYIDNIPFNLCDKS